MQSGQPLYLIGFMASGKTTLGRALTLRLPGYEFVDLDEAIECMAQKSIPDIFASEGEAVFRELEARALRQYSVPGSIIACGGGTPCYAANMDYMLANGRVVWLVADDEVTRRRLRLARGLRPLVDSLLDDDDALQAYITKLKESRSPYYSRANVVFDSNLLEDAAQIKDSCDRFIELMKALD